MRRSVHHGFTIIELLVVISLLSVIMLGLVSSMRGVAQTQEKVEGRIARLEDIRVTRNFLRQVLSRVSSEYSNAPDGVGKRLVPFSVNKKGLMWVGVLPARPDVGGRYFFRLSLEDHEGKLDLVLRLAPWAPDVFPPEWSNAEARVLAIDVLKFEVEAMGVASDARRAAGDWPVGWQIGWPKVDAIPDQLRLRVTDSTGEWPEWTVTLHALPQSDSGFSKEVVGGGAS